MVIQNKKPFTLVELIVVVTILVILSTIGFVSYSGYLKSNEVLTGSGTTFLDSSKKGWRRYDPNCDIDDITIGTQTWAGCNSTLGTGIEFINNSTRSCYDYNGNDNQACSDSQNLSNAKENAWNPKYGIDNIWGKLYTWDNAKTNACAPGYHLPTDSEWETLETTLNGGINCRNATDGWRCAGLGWKDHTTKTSSNNMVEALKIPLAGYLYSSTFCSRGNEMDFWSSTADSYNNHYGRGRGLNYGVSTVQRYTWNNNHAFSVRCIKD